MGFDLEDGGRNASSELDVLSYPPENACSPDRGRARRFNIQKLRGKTKRKSVHFSRNQASGRFVWCAQPTGRRGRLSDLMKVPRAPCSTIQLESPARNGYIILLEVLRNPDLIVQTLGQTPEAASRLWSRSTRVHAKHRLLGYLASLEQLALPDVGSVKISRDLLELGS